MKRLLFSMVAGLACSLNAQNIHYYSFPSQPMRTNDITITKKIECNHPDDFLFLQGIPLSETEYKQVMGNGQKREQKDTFKVLEDKLANILTLFHIEEGKEECKAPRGTGVYLTQSGLVLTTAHLFDEPIKKPHITGLTYDKENNRPWTTTLELCALTRKHDMALLRARSVPQAVKTLTLEQEIPQERMPAIIMSQQFYDSGHSSFYAIRDDQEVGEEEDNLEATVRRLDTGQHTLELQYDFITKTMSFGSVGNVIDKNNKRYLLYAIEHEENTSCCLAPLTGKMQPGTSGSPVFTIQGKLMGTVLWKDKEGINQGMMSLHYSLRTFIAEYQRRARTEEKKIKREQAK